MRFNRCANAIEYSKCEPHSSFRIPHSLFVFNCLLLFSLLDQSQPSSLEAQQSEGVWLRRCGFGFHRANYSAQVGFDCHFTFHFAMRTNTRFQSQPRPHAFLRVAALRVAALMLVVLLGLAPASSAMWQCEGRVCGTSAWTCCCTSPQPSVAVSPECDEQSGTRTSHLQSSLHQSEVGPCSVDCHCAMVVSEQSDVVIQSHHAFDAPVFQFAVLPRVFKIEAPLVNRSSRPLPSRGPPLAFLSFVSPSLRAPPAS